MRNPIGDGRRHRRPCWPSGGRRQNRRPPIRPTRSPACCAVIPGALLLAEEDGRVVGVGHRRAGTAGAAPSTAWRWTPDQRRRGLGPVAPASRRGPPGRARGASATARASSSGSERRRRRGLLGAAIRQAGSTLEGRNSSGWAQPVLDGCRPGSGARRSAHRRRSTGSVSAGSALAASRHAAPARTRRGSARRRAG